MQTISEALFVQIFKPMLEFHWRHKTEVCLDVTHCLGDPQDLSSLSTCLMYARNIAQLNPITGRYTDSSIPAFKITSADGWNGETAYHFGVGPRHWKTILSTWFLEWPTENGVYHWLSDSVVSLITALGTWIESFAMWNKVIIKR